MVVVLALAAASSIARAHDDSWSTTRVDVGAGAPSVALSVQTLSVVEVVAADTDGDAWLTVEELGAARDDVVRYLRAHHVVILADASGDAVPLELAAPTIARREDLSSLPPRQWLDVRWEAAAPASGVGVAAVSVESTLFLTTSPGHRSFVDVAWDGAVGETRVLWWADLRADFSRPEPPVPEPAPAPRTESVAEPPVELDPPLVARLDVLALVALAVVAAGGGLRGAAGGVAVAVAAGLAWRGVAHLAPDLVLGRAGSWALLAVAGGVVAVRLRVSEERRAGRLLAECLVWGVFVAGFARSDVAPAWPTLVREVSIWCAGALAIGFVVRPAGRSPTAPRR